MRYLLAARLLDLGHGRLHPDEICRVRVRVRVRARARVRVRVRVGVRVRVRIKAYAPAWGA